MAGLPRNDCREAVSRDHLADGAPQSCGKSGPIF